MMEKKLEWILDDLGVPTFTSKASKGAKESSNDFPDFSSNSVVCKGFDNAKQLDPIPSPHSILVAKRTLATQKSPAASHPTAGTIWLSLKIRYPLLLALGFIQKWEVGTI